MAQKRQKRRKAQTKRKKHQHLPPVGSSAQHRWDDKARGGNVGDASKWVGAMLAIIVVMTLVAFLVWNQG